MLKTQFNEAVRLAKTNECGLWAVWNEALDKCEYAPWFTAGRFEGFSSPDFKAVETDLTEVAQLIRYQAVTMDGSWDENAIEEVWQAARRKFIVTEGALTSIEITQLLRLLQGGQLTESQRKDLIARLNTFQART